MKPLLYLFLIFTILPASRVLGQSTDNGDGTFTNPVLWGDFPDPDVIRVGDTFYFVSTSMHFFPGVTILQSRDLVNWEIACNVVDEFREHPAYDMQGGTRYAKGQWATSLRHFGGEFHVLFNTNTEGSFIYSARTMDGPWRCTKIDGHKLYDPGMLVDNDGRVYVVSGNTNIYITELDTVTLQEKGPARLIYTSHRGGMEGNRAYHIGGYYYIYCTYGGDQSGETCLRSRSLYGPWEEREVMFESGNLSRHILHQSCIVDVCATTEGQGRTDYWGVIFQDRGGLGRVPWLVPIYWVNDWPLMGNPIDGITTMNKPVKHTTVAVDTIGSRSLSGSDEFSSTSLALKWQWNHNADKRKFSLTERPGWLRLHAATVTDSLRTARNTLCQRIFGPYSEATTLVDFSHLRLGDRAGLTVFAWPYAALQIERTAQGTVLSMIEMEQSKAIIRLKGSSVWLRATVDGITDEASFSYSLDGETFQRLGTEFQMQFDSRHFFCGNRYGLYCYSTRKLGGYADFDFIHVVQRPLFKRNIHSGSVLQAEWYDHQWNTECTWSDNDKDQCNQDITTLHDGAMIAFRNLTPTDSIHQVVISLKNHDAHNVFVELRNADNGSILGKASIPEPSTSYTDVAINLNGALPKCHRLEFRVWNSQWNQLSMGRVSIDKITMK